MLGHDLAAATARAVRRRVGLLGHATGLYDDLTVADNVRFWAARLRARPSADADAALDALGLDGRLADVAVARLSAGQRRRAVARRRSSPAAPSCGCSTSPTPASTPTGRDLLDDLVRRGRGRRRHGR